MEDREAPAAMGLERAPAVPASIAELMLTRAELDGLAAGEPLAIVVEDLAIVIRLEAPQRANGR